MNLKEYQVECQRTLVDKGIDMNKAHMIMGITGEISELIDAVYKGDIYNIQEECVDKVWFASNVATMYDIDVSTRPPIVIEDLDMLTLVYNISVLADLVKRNIIYGKDPDIAKITETVHTIIEFIVRKFKTKSWDFEQSLQNNIDKLRVRFPDKFTEELVNNRDLEAERRELEK